MENRQTIFDKNSKNNKKQTGGLTLRKSGGFKFAYYNGAVRAENKPEIILCRMRQKQPMT